MYVNTNSARRQCYELIIQRNVKRIMGRWSINPISGKIFLQVFLPSLLIDTVYPSSYTSRTIINRLSIKFGDLIDRRKIPQPE
jgi:hypothetical protein